MKRRNFFQLSVLTGVGLSLPMSGILNACTNHPEHSLEFKSLISNLLKDWCNGMIKVQINNPSNLEEHGALGCPSCSHIHGRCMDAVYPFLYMADKTGDKKINSTIIKSLQKCISRKWSLDSYKKSKILERNYHFWSNCISRSVALSWSCFR